MRDEVPKNQEPVIVAVRLDHIQKSQGSHPNLRLSPRPVMALELGTHPKPPQIADALEREGKHHYHPTAT